MKTQVLNIQPNTETNSLMVFMLVGDEQRQFTFSRQFDQIGNHQVEIITPDVNLEKLLNSTNKSLMKL